MKILHAMKKSWAIFFLNKALYIYWYTFMTYRNEHMLEKHQYFHMLHMQIIPSSLYYTVNETIIFHWIFGSLTTKASNLPWKICNQTCSLYFWLSWKMRQIYICIYDEMSKNEFVLNASRTFGHIICICIYMYVIIVKYLKEN